MIFLQKRLIVSTFLSLFLLLELHGHSQEIKGERIKVAPYAQAYLVFPATITDYDVDDKTNYTCRPRRDNGIIIITKSDNPPTTTLVVTEGNRTHHFVLTPMANYDPNKDNLYYDYSDLKVLKETAKKASQGTGAVTDPVPDKKPENKKEDKKDDKKNDKKNDPVIDNNAGSSGASAKDVEYAEAVAGADKQYAAKNYEDAKSGYTNALRIKPAEKYPKDRIEAIDRILEILNSAENERLKKENEVNTKYKEAIDRGDKAVDGGQYNQAKLAYYEALRLKPGESYPKTKIGALDAMLADLKAKEEAEKQRAAKEQEITQRYSAAISKADNAFKAQNYDAAKLAYNEALTIKPGENYPQSRLTDITNILEAKAAADKDKIVKAREKEINDKYNTVVAKADKAFAAKDYSTAQNSYEAARQIKPAEKHPQTRLDDIENILAAKAAADAVATAKKSEQENTESYNNAVSKGDKAFDKKDYDAAKAAYRTALDIKPGEAYPKKRLDETEGRLKKLADDAAAERERMAKIAEQNDKYRTAVTKADEDYTAGEFEDARKGYKNALGYKPGDTYATGRLTVIDNRVAAEKARLAQEKENRKKKEDADALARRQEEENRIAKAKEKEINDRYNEVILRADRAFIAKQYKEARSIYAEAMIIKPDDRYPKNKIEDIESIEDAAREAAAREAEKAREAALNEQYRELVSDADNALAANQFDAAKEAYRLALKLKPTAKYPQSRLADVDKAKRDFDRKAQERYDGSGNLREQKVPLPFNQAELYKKYPKIEFRMPPNGQKFTVDYFLTPDTVMNHNVSRDALMEKPRLAIKDSANKVSLTLEGISFYANNAYFKITVRNYSQEDFLVGTMESTLQTGGGDIINYHPCYVTGFPFLPSGRQMTFVFATRAAAISDAEQFNFLMNDRSKQTALKLVIPGSVYNKELAR